MLNTIDVPANPNTVHSTVIWPSSLDWLLSPVTRHMLKELSSIAYVMYTVKMEDGEHIIGLEHKDVG